MYDLLATQFPRARWLSNKQAGQQGMWPRARGGAAARPRQIGLTPVADLGEQTSELDRSLSSPPLSPNWPLAETSTSPLTPIERWPSSRRYKGHSSEATRHTHRPAGLSMSSDGSVTGTNGNASTLAVPKGPKPLRAMLARGAACVIPLISELPLSSLGPLLSQLRYLSL